MKNIRIFIWKLSDFLWWKFQYIWIGVFSQCANYLLKGIDAHFCFWAVTLVFLPKRGLLKQNLPFGGGLMQESTQEVTKVRTLAEKLSSLSIKIDNDSPRKHQTHERAKIEVTVYVRFIWGQYSLQKSICARPILCTGLSRTRLFMISELSVPITFLHC